ncbi:unnamed protein product [Rotaria sp. Silwood1]|nr:unnamed protein product [Rotaria sp. Silwood1]
MKSLDISTSNVTEQKTVQYLRPTSFKQQQKEMQQLNKNKMEIIPYATFHENTTVSSSMNNRLSQLSLDRNGDREHLSDIESQTDPDGGQSEADKEVIRQIFDISRALETFDDYKEIKEWINQDTTLFVYSQKDKILSIIETNLKQSKSVNIVVTQPRRIAARSLCEHISISRNWPVGQTVGYQTSLNKQRCELTRILYCTTDVLLQRLILTKTFQDFTHIILDEVHERDQ